jgi:hypothetical protein
MSLMLLLRYSSNVFAMLMLSPWRYSHGIIAMVQSS